MAKTLERNDCAHSMSETVIIWPCSKAKSACYL